ncbi:transporter substrate-binding domain-containing protein [Streptomyces sp. AJS327]|uniref:ABC transporter substrate-binding protein n=1 Tax=Streptomyces sp. AJS327 TaxID=2545265 RepID=UPI0015DE6624|nr:ABC transporter substrate-binding protein [Streptomyces sp. AJS327]MBA0050177.1 transporter substrate-binding domain-containing protein [Streptomyces sp. AJS327]
MRRRSVPTLVIGTAVVTALASVLSACGESSSSSGGGKVVIRAGWVPTVHTTHWATTSQFVKDSNIEIKLSPFKSNNEMLVAMQSGSLDMMTMGFNNTATALVRGPVNYSYVAGAAEGGTRLLVRKGVKVSSWKDLRGKRVSSVRGSTQYQQLALAMREQGLNLDKDTKFSNVAGAPDMLLALQRGDVDAVSLWEPQAAEAVRKGYGHEVPALRKDLYEDSFRLNTGLAASDSFRKKHPKELRAVLQGYDKAHKKITSDEDWWLTEFGKLAVSDRKNLQEGIKNVSPETSVDKRQMVEVAKRLHRGGQISKDVSAEMAKTVDYGPLSKATGRSPAKLGDS